MPKPPPCLGEILEAVGPLLQVMNEALVTLGRLDGLFLQTPGGVNFTPWVLLRPLRIREARLSSKIENTVASAAEVGMAAAGRSEQTEPREVENYIRAIELAIEKRWPTNEATIRALHRELLNGLPDMEAKHAGRYRPGQVYLGHSARGFQDARFVPPPAAEVPRLMAELVSFMRDSGDVPRLIAAGIAHYQFETIHPFSDGNGRLGRMLITLSLCDDGMLSEPLIYPSAYIERSRQEYYDRLLRVSTHNDWHGWLAYFLDAVHSEAHATGHLIRRLLELREKYIGTFTGRRLGQGIIAAIDHLFESPVTSVALMHGKIGGSDQTARNYVDQLVEHGVLRLHARVGREQWFSAWEILKIADADDLESL